MRSVALIAVALLAGCATGSGQESYFLISKGGAGAVARLFTGGVEYCKVTQGNLQGVAFTADVEFDGENCKVSATAANE